LSAAGALLLWQDGETRGIDGERIVAQLQVKHRSMRTGTVSHKKTIISLDGGCVSPRANRSRAEKLGATGCALLPSA
jgi:hypothetical protein